MSSTANPFDDRSPWAIEEGTRSAVRLMPTAGTDSWRILHPSSRRNSHEVLPERLPWTLWSFGFRVALILDLWVLLGSA